jgi:pantoate--beta-alanine ligase
VREPDGLAMSSRNAYLTADQRRSAAAMFAAITDAARSVAQGGDIAAATTKARQHMLYEGFEKVDYVEVRDAVTLKPVDAGSPGRRRVLAAAWLGKTRLIDNVAVAT